MAAAACETAVYQRALDLARTGRHERALRLLREHLLAQPKDARALNDAGTILYALGRHDQAARHLRAALHLADGYPPETAWNLAQICLADTRSPAVLDLLDELLAADALPPELANHAAMKLIQRGDLGGAVEALLRSFQVRPRQDELLSLYHQVRALRAKVGLFCELAGPQASAEVHEFLRARFETRPCRQADTHALREVLDWCDVAWFESCGPQLVAASHMAGRSRLVCRLHGHEAHEPWAQQVDWARVDLLVSEGNSHVLGWLRDRLALLPRRPRIEVVPCGIDVDALPFVERPRGRRLACVQHGGCVEGAALVLQCFHKLHAVDPRFRLFIARGPAQNDILAAYLRTIAAEMGLADAVTFDAPGEGLVDWLQDKHYVVSCGLHEGRPVGVLKGMACGLKPVVHVRPGWRDYFLAEHVFGTVDEFCHRVLAGPWTPGDCRRFVADRYPIRRRNARLREALGALEREPIEAAAPPTARAASGVPAAAAIAAPAPRGTDAHER